MARLLSGISIYLTVLLLLFYASPSPAVDRLPDEAVHGANARAAKPQEGKAFDLSSLRLQWRDMPSGHAIPPRQTGFPHEADFGSLPPPPVAGRRFLGPALSYRPGTKGPVIELGIFGGTIKPRQKLAHVALDWDF